jgi:hypothetical protein
MNEEVVRAKVGQLLSEVNRATVVERPQEAGLHPPGSRQDSTMRREMAALEDNLDHVRLAIKYLVFDLEATKRENRLLKELLGRG